MSEEKFSKQHQSSPHASPKSLSMNDLIGEASGDKLRLEDSGKIGFTVCY